MRPASGRAAHSLKGRPVLVTGVPRSGTTWLARALAQGSGSALAGREPMNPRGDQYGLGGTLTGWVRLTDPSHRQTRLLRSAYRGTNVSVYSRFGHRQWTAPLPWSRVIVKDPFAMLSLPAVTAVTRAVPVLVFRHPAAVLSSYRRMGWTADTAELAAVLPDRTRAAASLGALPGADGADGADDGAASMARFWTALNGQAVADLDLLDEAVVVAHEDIARGGAPAMRRLYEMLDLPWSPRVERLLDGSAPSAAASGGASTLHNFNRSSAAVATGWREAISADDLAVVESIAGPTLRLLSERRVDVRPAG